MISKVLSIISLMLFLGLMIIYPLKKLKINNIKKEEKKNIVYFILKKNHTIIGILFIVISLVHGIVSIKSGATKGIISGKITWILVFLMSIIMIFKNINKDRFMKIHRIMSIIVTVLIIIHIGGVLI